MLERYREASVSAKACRNIVVGAVVAEISHRRE